MTDGPIGQQDGEHTGSTLARWANLPSPSHLLSAKIFGRTPKKTLTLQCSSVDLLICSPSTGQWDSDRSPVSTRGSGGQGAASSGTSPGVLSRPWPTLHYFTERQKCRGARPLSHFLDEDLSSDWFRDCSVSGSKERRAMASLQGRRPCCPGWCQASSTHDDSCLHDGHDGRIRCDNGVATT